VYDGGDIRHLQNHPSNIRKQDMKMMHPFVFEPNNEGKEPMPAECTFGLIQTPTSPVEKSKNKDVVEDLLFRDSNKPHNFLKFGSSDGVS
jgi:hypothetical protein